MSPSYDVHLLAATIVEVTSSGPCTASQFLTHIRKSPKAFVPADLLSTKVPSETVVAFLTDYFSKEKVEKVLIGEPKQMNGEPSESTPIIEAFVQKFKATFPDMKTERVDERFTSKMAFQTMIDSGLKKKQRQNKGLIDEISATIMLQDYLNRK